MEQLQEEHSTQIRLETESQKTFEFMKNQVASSAGILLARLT